MGDKSAFPDVAIAVVAARQHGAITHRQLLTAGLGRNAISKRVHAGRLHRLHRGVYAVGHTADSAERRWMAAVLACGPGAALSQMSAAVLWQLLRPVERPVDVSVPTQSGRRRQTGIRLHRCESLRPDQLTCHKGIPVTTPARTIADLAGIVAPRWVRRAIRQAEIQGLRLGSGVETDRTRSDLERDFLRLCRRHGLPAPEVNVKVGRWTVDFLWRCQRVAVETDFYEYHRGRVAFQDDRERDLDLRRRGFEVRRFSERQVNDQPAEVAADLRDALALAS
jgi:very-short-patch-repair endonuclease